MEVNDSHTIVTFIGYEITEDNVVANFHGIKENKDFKVILKSMLGGSILQEGANYTMRNVPGGTRIVEGYAFM